MASPPPNGFLEIIEAVKKTDQSPYNVIGLCVDYLAPAQSRGSDLTMKIQLWDASCLGSPELNSDGMLIRCFSKERKNFPPIHDIGDIVIARNIKTIMRGSQRFGISSLATRWTIISASSLLDGPDPHFSRVFVRRSHEEPFSESRSLYLELGELQYAKALLEAKDPSTLRVAPKSTTMDENSGNPHQPHKKFRMLRDITSPNEALNPQFVDLIGEVRKVYSGTGNPVEVQLTDYTEHPLLFDYAEEGDVSGHKGSWKGPWGKLTITINAWDQHGQFIINNVQKGAIDLGTYFRLTNVQIKMDKFGTYMQGHLRGGGSNSTTGITIHNANDASHIPELKDLIARKRLYNINRKSKAIGLVKDAPSRKRSADDKQEERPKTKKAKRKTAKRREERCLASNQHIRCEGVNVPFTTVATILEARSLDRVTPAGNPYRLPFQNCKYKCKVQIVDFFPDKLQDFAIPFRISDYEALSDYDNEDDEVASLDYARHNPTMVKWKWHFLLMVQDPIRASDSGEEPKTMLLQVSGQSGDYLLNMEACNLRDNPRNLAQLKEKMFVLWGNLEEKKAEIGNTGMWLRKEKVSVSSKPFECLIKEYGVNARSADGQTLDDDWERMFTIFGTNIG